MTTGEWNVIELLVMVGVAVAMWCALLLPARPEPPNQRAGNGDATWTADGLPGGVGGGGTGSSDRPPAWRDGG
jgi:hypothetical protein